MTTETQYQAQEDLKTTTFFLLPAPVTDQEMIDYELKICKFTDIKDQDGNAIDSDTPIHSNYVIHPIQDEQDSNFGTRIYSVNSRYKKAMAALADKEARDNYRPSANFASTTDDKEYTNAEIKELGFSPDE